MKIALAIITVVYKNYSILQDYLSSLEKQTDSNFHLFIVDVSKNIKKIEIKDISNTIIYAENKGYADALNVGVAAAEEEGYSRFCLMNDDTYFGNNFVKNVSSSLEKHPCSLIGGKIYYAPGFEYHKERYSKDDLGKVLWYAGGEMDWKNAYTIHTGINEVDTGQCDSMREISFVTGCLVCYDKAAKNSIGEWDASYFLFYEDADFSARALQNKIKIFYDPLIILWHKSGQSSEGGAGSAFHKKFQEKNMVIFGLKYAPFKTKLYLIKNFFLKKLMAK